jgi:hypothetical protein
VINFCNRFHNQKCTTTKQDKASAGDGYVPDEEERVNHFRNEVDGRKQQNPDGEGKHQTYKTRALLVFLIGYVTTDDRNENDVVNPQHDFQNNQCEEAENSTKRGKYFNECVEHVL